MKNKRILQVIALIALFIPTWLAIYNISVISSDELTVENVNKVMVTAQNETTYEYTERNDIKIYIETVDKATEVNESIRHLEAETPMLLSFFKGENKIDYYLYLTLNNLDCLIMDKDGKLFHMRSADADKLLSQSLSDVFYENNHIPTAEIMQGDAPVTIYPAEGDWYLKKPDNTFKLSSVRNLLSLSNKVEISKDRPLGITFAIEPDMISLKVLEDKAIIFDDLLSNFTELNITANKKLTYELSVEWLQNDIDDYHGKAKYNLDVNYKVPASYSISKTEVIPGELIAVSAINLADGDNVSLSTAEMGFEMPFISIGANKIALLPISADSSGKTFNISLFTGAGAAPDIYKIIVSDKKFDKKNVSSQKEVMENHMSPAPQKDKKSTYEAIFAKGTQSEKFWTDKFGKPYEGNILIDFGTEVTTNKSYPYINEGVNISTIKGVTIIASNAGKVIFTGTVPDDGKLVVIDHGFGIKSWYGHLDSFSLAEGDNVAKGQEIGLGGKSGVFTNLGENLIFKISIGNVFVNPLLIIENGIPGIDNEIITPLAAEEPEIPTEPATDENGEFITQQETSPEVTEPNIATQEITVPQ